MCSLKQDPAERDEIERHGSIVDGKKKKEREDHVEGSQGNRGERCHVLVRYVCASLCRGVEKAEQHSSQETHIRGGKYCSGRRDMRKTDTMGEERVRIGCRMPADGRVTSWQRSSDSCL